MRNTKRKPIIAIISMSLLLSICLYGCGSERVDGQEEELIDTVDHGIDTSSISSMINTTPEHIKIDLGKNISIDADVALPLVEAMPIVDTVPIRFDKNSESIQKVVFGTESYTTESSVGFVYGGIEELGSHYSSTTGSGKELLILPDLITYQTALQNKYGLCFIYQPTTTLVDPYTQEEFTSFSREEALKQANELLDNFNVSVDSNPEIFSITADSLNSAKKSLLEGEEDPTGVFGVTQEEVDYIFSEGDEYYSIFYRLSIGSVPVTKTNLNSWIEGESTIMGSMARVDISKKGIIGFEILFSIIQNSVLDNPDALISVDDAMAILQGKYDEVISNKSISISQISLEYVASPANTVRTEMRYVPSWVFTRADDPDSSLRINAVDGTFL